jgi:hypothetical protein
MTTNVILADWFDRRRDTIEDVANMTRIALSTPYPSDILNAQLRFASLAFGRLAADVSAAHELTQEMLGLWPTSTQASRSAAATRAAGQPLREAARHPQEDREAAG